MTSPATPSADGTISIDDFSKVDLRIARIVKAEHRRRRGQAPEAHARRRRRDAHGIRPASSRRTIRRSSKAGSRDGGDIAPRKMKFGVSEGMVLAASGEGPGLFLPLARHRRATGMKVK